MEAVSDSWKNSQSLKPPRAETREWPGQLVGKWVRLLISWPVDFRVRGDRWAPGCSDFQKGRKTHKPCSFLKVLPLAVGGNE